MGNYNDPATLERLIAVLQRRVGNVERLGSVGGSGGLDENDVLNVLGYQNIVWVGDANYQFKAADTASLIVMSPAAGVTRYYQMVDFNTEPAYAGNWQDVVNLGPGFVSTYAGSNVVTTPTGTRGFAINEEVTVKLLNVSTANPSISTFLINGGSPAQPPSSQPPNNAALPVIAYPSGKDATTAGTLFVTSDGAWSDAVTGQAITPSAITREWRKNGTAIAGQSGTAYVATRPASEGFDYTVAVKATGGNGQISPFYVSNILSIVAPSTPRFTAPYPKIVGTAGQDISQAAVNEYVQLALGPTPPTVSDVEVFNPDNSLTPPYNGRGTSRGHPTGPDYIYQVQSGDGANSEKIYYRLTHDGLASDGTPSPTETLALQCIPGGQQGTSTPPGGTTPPPTGNSRDAAVYPFGVHAPWNEPMKTGATFGGANDVRTKAIRNTDGIGGAAFVNCTNGYSVQPTFASVGDPNRTIRTLVGGVVTATKTAQIPDTRYISSGTDHTFACYFPDRSQCDDAWQTVNNGLNIDCQATTRHYTDERGSGFDRGCRAAGASYLGGLIRAQEVNGLLIRHALVCSIGAMKAKKGFVWPAISEDKYASRYGPAQNGIGAIPLGTLFAIPPGVDIATIAGLSAIGKAIGYALQQYGLYVTDTGGPGATANTALYGEPTIAQADVDLMVTAWGILRGYVDVVSNADQNNPKGAGTTLVTGAIYLDPIGGDTSNPPTPPPTSTGPSPGLDSDITWASWNSFPGTISWGHSTGTGVNRYGLLLFGFGRGDNSISALSIGGTALTRIGSAWSGNASTDRKVEAWEVLNPPASASLTSQVQSLLGASSLQFGFLSFSDVLAGTPHGSVGTATVTGGTIISVSAGAATTDLIVAVAAMRSTRASAALGGGQTGRINGLGSPSGSTNTTNLLFAVSTQPGGSAAVASTFNFGTAVDVAAALAIPIKYAGTGVVIPPPAGTTALAMIQNDQANYRVGTFAVDSSTVDYSERHALNAAFDWSYGPRVSGTPFSNVISGTQPRLIPRLMLFEGVGGGNDVGTLVEISDVQLWAQYNDGQWVRVSYSLGPTFWELYSDAAAGGTPRASKFATGGTGATLKTYLGSTPPTGYANQAQSMFQVQGPDADSAGWSSPHNAANLHRLLMAVRVRLDPTTYDAAANYVVAGAIDRADAAHTNQYDVGIGRFKAVQQGWRVFVCATGPTSSLDLADPFPTLTGVLADTEYVILTGSQNPPPVDPPPVIPPVDPPPPPPPPPPSGTTRDAGLQPGGSAYIHNRAVGGSATYAGTSDPATADFRSGGTAINAGVYSQIPTFAKATDPNITMTDTAHGNAVHTYRAPNINIALPTNGDKTTAVVDPTKKFVDTTWNTTKTGTNSYTCQAYHRDDIGETGTGYGGSVRASGMSPYYGFIREHELRTSSPTFPHLLHVAVPSERAKAGPIWPANAQDSYSNQYGGNINLGTVFAIPPATSFAATGATDNAWARALYSCLVNYGVCAADTTYPGTANAMILCAEQTLEGSTQLSSTRTAWSQMRDDCRRITNHSQSTPKGGGTPLLPDLPPVG